MTMASGFHASLKTQGQLAVTNARSLKTQDHDQLIMQNHHHASVTQKEDCRKPFAINALLSGAKMNSSCFNQGTCLFGKDLKRPMRHMRHMLQDWKKQKGIESDRT